VQKNLANPKIVISLLCFICLFLQQSSEQLRKLYDSTDKYKKIVGSVLSKMFSRQFPHGLTAVSTSELLNWESWPVCLSIHSKYKHVCMHAFQSLVLSHWTVSVKVTVYSCLMNYS
jgi:hypothetical protein